MPAPADLLRDRRDDEVAVHVVPVLSGDAGGEWPVRVDMFMDERVGPGDVDSWRQSASLHDKLFTVILALNAARVRTASQPSAR